VHIPPSLFIPFSRTKEEAATKRRGLSIGVPIQPQDIAFVSSLQDDSNDVENMSNGRDARTSEGNLLRLLIVGTIPVARIPQLIFLDANMHCPSIHLPDRSSPIQFP
jgi:hypothetical protein